MTSDRMMQAIGRIERAISRLQTAVEKSNDRSEAQNGEVTRLRGQLRAMEAHNADLQCDLEQARETPQHDPAFPEQHDPHAMNPFSHDKALAALRSLDSLIDDLQKARRDG